MDTKIVSKNNIQNAQIILVVFLYDMTVLNEIQTSIK